MESSFSSLHKTHRFTSTLNFRTRNSLLSSQASKPISLKTLKLGFRTTISSSSTNPEKDPSSSVCPVYAPTPPNRDLRTPHSGYHFDGTSRKFFEGWYFKVSIPQRRQSFCFMYSVENPAFRKRLTPCEVAQNGPRSTGVGAQVLGPYDKYICQYAEESHNFWGSKDELMLGNAFVAEKQLKPPNKEVPPKEFDRRVMEGFQVTPLWHQGSICDDGRSDYVETVPTARWEYITRPIYGWGDVGSKQKSTAGWLAAFPIGIHFSGKFYEFAPWNGVVSWEIAPWGYWSLAAENETHKVELEATAEDPGTTLRAPTAEAGLAPACKDTCFGVLKLQMWERRYDGSKGKMILDVKSNMAAVEVGGGPWFTTWKGKTSTPELLSRALRVPVDVEGLYNLVPLFKPPGL